MADTPRETVLLVDDEPAFLDLLGFNLGEAGLDTEAARSGSEALALADRVLPAVVVLDLMLPDLSGIEVCRRLRASPSTSDAGILMLTARGDDYDRIIGFEAGADDYVVKPFNMREVVLRVRALVRRTQEHRAACAARNGGPRLQWRGIEIDPARHEATLDGEPLSLRPLELKLLTVLLENPGRLFARSALLEEVWGVPGHLSTRTIETHVGRLRSRLGPYGDVVETVPGLGYRLRTLPKG